MGYSHPINYHIEAFNMFVFGFPLKQIALKLGVTEKTIADWKKQDDWVKKLQVQEKTNIAGAFLLVSENIRQGVQIQTNNGKMAKEQADNLHEALTTIYKTLKENFLIQ